MTVKVWTLNELRTWARELLDDPQMDSFPDPRMDLLLNTAYGELVTEIQSSGAIIGLQTEVLTVTADAREYVLAADTVHVMDVARQVTATAQPATFHRVPFSERNKRTSGYYLFWNTESGLLTLGFCTPVPPAMSVDVTAVRQQAQLAEAGDVPTQLPIQHRELIALKAAMIGKINQKRGPAGVAALYTDARENFRSWMGHATASPKQAVPL